MKTNYKAVAWTGGCSIDLYMNELERAKLTRNFRVIPNKDFAVQLTNDKIYISLANKIVLTKNVLEWQLLQKGQLKDQT